MHPQHDDHQALQHHVARHPGHQVFPKIIRQRHGQRQRPQADGKQISLTNPGADRLIPQLHRRGQQHQAGRQRAERHFPAADGQRSQRRKPKEIQCRREAKPHARVVEHRQQPRLFPQKPLDSQDGGVALFRRLPQKNIHVLFGSDVNEKAAHCALQAAPVEVEPPADVRTGQPDFSRINIRRNDLAGLVHLLLHPFIQHVPSASLALFSSIPFFLFPRAGIMNKTNNRGESVHGKTRKNSRRAAQARL